jgi:hypothetical protein
VSAAIWAGCLLAACFTLIFRVDEARFEFAGAEIH